MEWSPTVFSGPCGRRIIERSTSNPCPLSASTMSKFVTEPNKCPSTPAFWVTWTMRPSSFAPFSCAAARVSDWAFSSSARFFSNSARLSGVARFALPCGRRKLRAYPSFTLTTSPRAPRLTTFSRRITCIAAPSVQVGVGHQREIARALHRRRELALVVGARSGDPRRDDLAVLADEVLQQVDVLVVDPLDLLSGEAAELAALE